MGRNNKEMRFRKISLELLLDTLTHIWDSGADYVDIIGIQGDEQDVINIVVQEDYMSDDIEEYEGEEEDNSQDNNMPLTDEDINNLI
jgi:hypothetical protein